MWAEKITDYTNIVSGKKYYIGATSSSTDYYLSVDGSSTSTSIAGTAVTDKSSATKFVFEGSGTSWTIKFDGTSNYLGLKSSKDNGKVQVVSSTATFTLSNQSEKIRLTIGSYSVQKNNAGTQFGSYGNTQTDVWLEEVSSGGSTKYNVTVANDIANGSVTASTTSAAEGANVTLTATPSTGYEFGSWNVTNASTSAAITVTDNQFTMPAANVNVSATFNQIQGGGEPSGDGTTYNFADMTDFSSWGTSYEKKTTTFSDGAYVELASANKSTSTITDCPVTKGGDVIFKAPEGKVITSLTFTCTQWTTKAQTITLNTSSDGANYTSTSTTSTNFVLSASNLTNVSAVKFTFNSSSNQVGVKSIKVTYEDASSKTTPTLSFEKATYDATMGEDFTAPALNNPKNVTVTYSSSAEDVATVNATTGVIELVGAGTTTITASYDGSESDTYNSNSASYQLVVAAAPAPALTTVDEIFAAATTAGSTAAEVRVTFNNWVISGLNGTKNAYLTDNNGKGLIIFDNNASHGFAAGDILSGTVTCNVQLFNGAAEITSLASTTEGLTVTKGGSVSEQTIAIADLAGANTGALVAYENLTYHLNGTSAEFSDGENVIVAYKGIMNALPELVEGKTYDIKGIFLMYGTKKEILPRSAEDIVLNENINNYIVTFDETLNGTITVKYGETVINDGDEVAEGTELTIECTPANEDYRFVNWQYKAGEAAWATRTKDFTYTMPSANVQFKATFEEIPVYTVTYMSLGSPAGTEQVKAGNKIANAPSVSLTDWTFVGWTTNGSYTDSETAPALFDDAITETTTLYAVFSQGENGAAGSASLTNGEICDNVGGSYADGSITNTYGTWNYNAAKQGNYSSDGEYFLQLRNNNTVSYLQIPEMAGNITSIELGRVCNTSKAKYTGSIYFRSEKSNEATAIATATQSTALTDVTLTIPDGYKTGYVMVSGACRIESVTVNYTTGGTKTYTITGPLPDGGTINFVATTGDGKYYATFSSTRGVKFDEVFVNDPETCMASVKAYAVAVIDGQILKTSLTEDYNDGNYTYIPANTGVLFEYVLEDGYTFDGAVPFEYADAETEYLDPVEDNMLVACPTTGACPTVEGTNFYYKLAYGDNTNKTKLGFWWGAADGSSNFKVKAGGAVIVVSQSAGSNLRGFRFEGEGTTTAIESINNAEVAGEIFNLQGQRMSRIQKGVYIINGKKVLR